MTSDNCPICQDLSAKAVTAITQHVKLTGKKGIAEIQQDRAALLMLTPLLDAAAAERERAVAEYRNHRDSHPLADARTAG